MYKLGVIPAGGKGERWGGYLKEMLPINRGDWFIDHSIKAMTYYGDADAILIITNPVKVGSLANHLTGKHGVPIYYAVEDKGLDIWGGIEECFAYPADRYLFAMPDTYYPLSAFLYLPEGDFLMGTFKTNKPERFGVISNGHVVNKKAQPPGEYKAWGTLVWSAACVELWRERKPATYTEAINMALDLYGIMSYEMDYYFDMATFEDYREFLRAGVL